MNNKNERISIISEFKEKSLNLLDIRFLPPKIIIPTDLDEKDDYKFLSREVEQVKIKDLNLQFLTPSMVALQINIANESLREIKKLEARIRSIPSEQNIEDRALGEKVISHTIEVYEFIEKAQKSIIFSFAALEAFINLSIPENFIWKKDGTKNSEIYTKTQIERYLSWKEKLKVVVEDIYQLPQIKQMTFWSRLMELLEIRNRLVHLKSSDDTDVLHDILNKDILKICFSSQQFINYIYENATENENVKSKDLEKFPIISNEVKIRLVQKSGSVQPVYVPEEFR